MENIILINPMASKVKANPRLIHDIMRVAGHHAWIMQPKSIEDLHHTLSRMSEIRRGQLTRLFLVGGDGHFHHVLNWLMTHPEGDVFALCPIGGGQFNFMSKHIGLSSSNPVRNIRRILTDDLRVTETSWRPVCVHDSEKHEVKYGAVAANGVIHDVVSLYNQSGKGNLFGVTRVISQTMARFFHSRLRRVPSQINTIEGTLTVDGTKIYAETFACVVVSSVEEFIPWCRPFKESIEPDQCAIAAYWGGLGSLAASVPLVWVGTTSPLTDQTAVNANARHITFETRETAMIFDGDLIRWRSCEGNPLRTFTFTRAKPIKLLCVT